MTSEEEASNCHDACLSQLEFEAEMARVGERKVGAARKVVLSLSFAVSLI